eukprot:tig00021435_g21382.t1
MGKSLSKLLGGKKAYRICVVGLDSSGKTSLLYRLKLDKAISTIPTVGYNTNVCGRLPAGRCAVESVQFKNIQFDIWDLGGQQRLRDLWKHYYKEADGVIFVVDSHDQARMDEAIRELNAVVANPQTSRAVLLVMANKQDLPEAQPVAEIERLLAPSLPKTRPYLVLGTSVVSGQGVNEGLEWLASSVRKRVK